MNKRSLKKHWKGELVRLLKDIWRVVLTDLKIRPWNGFIFINGSYWAERYGGGIGYVCKCKNCYMVYGTLSYDLVKKKFLIFDICPYCGSREYEWITDLYCIGECDTGGECVIFRGGKYIICKKLKIK